ncbi:Meiotic activator RIM4 [Ilyonectria robusta]
MPPYSTKDLPEAGRRSESLRKSVSFDQASFASHSDCISSSALRSRSSSPGSRDAIKSASDIGKDSSTSQSFTKGSVSEDDVFSSNESFLPHGHGNERRTETEVGLVVRNPPYVDPQVIYSPKACVFIANLSKFVDDATLKAEVTKLFSEYGECFTKIKRDHKNTPIAFCQFTQIAHANMAHIHGHGRIILDRGCRVEMVRGNLTFLVWKRSGERTLLKEANSLLEPYGAISKVENLEKEVQDLYFLPLSVIVEYEMFDARRDVLGSMKGHPVFMVNLLSTVLSTRPPSKEQHKLEMEDQAELEQYYKDSRSIYVGNLPPCANEDLVRLITTPCGVVLSIQMKQVTSTSGAVFRHAFVEFDNTESPNMAVQYCHGRVVEGYPIRVQNKKRKLPNTPQRTPSGATTPASSLHQHGRSFHRSASSNSSFPRHPRHHRQQSVVDPWLTSSRAMTLRAPTGPSAGTRYLTNAPSQVTSQPLAGGHTHVEQPVTRALPQIDGPQAHPQPAVTQDCSEQGAAQACPQPAVTQDCSEQVAAQACPQPADTQAHSERERVATQTRSEPVVPEAHTQPADSQASRPAAIRGYPQPSATRSFSSVAELAADRAEQAAERAENMKLRRATSFNILDTHPEASEDGSLSPGNGDESSDDYSTSPEKPAETFENEAKSSGNVTERGTKTVNSEAIVTENGSQPVFDPTSLVVAHPPQQFMQMGQQSQPFVNPGYTNADMQMQSYMPPPMVHQNMPNGMAHMNNNQGVQGHMNNNQGYMNNNQGHMSLTQGHMNNNQGYMNNNQGDINHTQGPMNNTQAHMYNAMANMHNAQAPMYNAQGQMLNAMPQQMHTQPNTFFPPQGMTNAMPPMHQQANPYPVQQYPPQGMAPNMSFGYPQNQFQQHAPLQSAHHQLPPYPQSIQYQTPHQGFTHNALGGQMHHSTVPSIPLETPTAGPMSGQIQGQGQSGTQQQAATVAKEAN